MLLALSVGCGCGPKVVAPIPPAPVSKPGPITRVILSNELPGAAELCVALPTDATADDINTLQPRLACWGTVGDLRRAMVHQQRAD